MGGARGIEYAPGPFAGRASEVHPTPSGGVSWRHLLSSLSSSPFGRGQGGEGDLGVALSGEPVSLTTAFLRRLRENEAEWISSPGVLLCTDQRFPETLSDYLSPRVGMIICRGGRMSRKSFYFVLHSDLRCKSKQMNTSNRERLHVAQNL